MLAGRDVLVHNSDLAGTGFSPYAPERIPRRL